jgi:hypothetical protein
MMVTAPASIEMTVCKLVISWTRTCKTVPITDLFTTEALAVGV